MVGMKMSCPSCGGMLQVPSSEAFAEAQAMGKDAAMAREDVEETKKGSTSRIDIPANSVTPRPKPRTVVIHRRERSDAKGAAPTPSTPRPDDKPENGRNKTGFLGRLIGRS